MENTKRVYKRKTFSVPFTYTAQEYPPVASATQPLPLSDAGMFVEKEHSGVVKNSSLDGFCFEADSPIAPGTEITAKMKPPMVAGSGSDDLTECRAIVKWCNTRETDAKQDIEVGVKRIREEILPIINFDKKSFGSLKVF